MLVELQAQFHHGFSLDLQYTCYLFRFLDRVHTVLQNWLPSRKCSQEAQREYSIVRCHSSGWGQEGKCWMWSPVLVWYAGDFIHLSWTILIYFPTASNQNATGALSASQWSCARISSSLCNDFMCCVNSSSCFDAFLNSASFAFVRWCRIFQPLTGLECTEFFVACVLFLLLVLVWFFNLLALKSFKNLPEARYIVAHIWSVKLELPGQ